MKKNKIPLSISHPHLMLEWDFVKNGDLRPEEITHGSHKRPGWRCSKGHYWEASVYNRAGNNSNCPYCFGRVPTKENNLLVAHPELCKEWDREKNAVPPDSVSKGTDKKFWWACKKCHHSWKASVNGRTHKSDPRGCPSCYMGCISGVSQRWLGSLNIPAIKKEFYIKSLGLRVDGFNPETNTVYEFLGDFWHGNPLRFDSEKINPVNKKSFGQLYKNTMNRLRLLEKAGYKIVYIWESEFSIE